MLRAAGFEELRDFEEVDTRKVAAFNQLPDVLRAAVHKLPALVAKMVESERSQRGRQQGIDQLENAIGVLDEHAAGGHRPPQSLRRSVAGRKELQLT